MVETGGEQPERWVRADAVRSIVEAMAMADLARMVIVSNSARVAAPGDDRFPRFVVKPLILCPLLRHSLAGMSAAEHVVRDSALDWTIVRAPQLSRHSCRSPGVA
ncbi:NAD(P)H-binding protein [Nocardia sp. SC052]|uniref:NAD(P)H-binding protein n=1 Tax=Nocardia sichangensis TaxID=3385975 RepID=UPI0039A0ED1F